MPTLPMRSELLTAAVQLDKDWKRGLLSDAEYCNGLAALARPYTPPDAPGLRAAAWRAAGKTGENRLSVADLKHLEHTKGSTDAM